MKWLILFLMCSPIYALKIKHITHEGYYYWRTERTCDDTPLSKKVDQFIKNKKIIDIKYSSSLSTYKGTVYYEYSVLIMYE